MMFKLSAVRALGGLLAVSAVLGLAACSDNDPVDPIDVGGNVEGAWTAISFGGQPLPLQEFFVDPERGTCLLELEDVVLAFSADGTYAWNETRTIECGSGPPETETETFTGTYRVEGIRLFMTDSEETAEQESTFSVVETTLTLRQRFGSVTLTSVFERSAG